MVGLYATVDRYWYRHQARRLDLYVLDLWERPGVASWTYARLVSWPYVDVDRDLESVLICGKTR